MLIFSFPTSTDVAFITKEDIINRAVQSGHGSVINNRYTQSVESCYTGSDSFEHPLEFLGLSSEGNIKTMNG